MSDTPIMGITELTEGQSIPATHVNEHFGRRLEQGAGAFSVKNQTNTPPGSPADGDSYIVTATATGAWTGWENSISYYQSGTGWKRILPREGMLAWDQTGNNLHYYDGSAWTDYSTGAGSLNLGSTVTQSGTPSSTSVGFLGSPQIADQDTYTLALTDAGGHYYHISGSAHTLTIPANSSVAFPIGTVIVIVNEDAAGLLTLAITTDTLRWGASTGSRTIAANGTASLLKVTSTVWRLTGDGIT